MLEALGTICPTLYPGPYFLSFKYLLSSTISVWAVWLGPSQPSWHLQGKLLSCFKSILCYLQVQALYSQHCQHFLKLTLVPRHPDLPWYPGGLQWTRIDVIWTDLLIQTSFGNCAPFLFYGTFSIFGIFFIYNHVPETRRKTAKDVSARFNKEDKDIGFLK